ncbi:MAG: spondin domain-containing protein [Thiotrichales bacterium]|nr:spondin domain-containing protein [Thiotrichales bacterium]
MKTEHWYCVRSGMTSPTLHASRRPSPTSAVAPRCAPEPFPEVERAAREGRLRRMGLLAVLLPAALTFAPVAWGQANDSVTYRMTFTGLWTADDITDSSLPGTAHFTQVVGAKHNASTTLWRIGDRASAGVENVAEDGITRRLLSEIGSNPNTDGAILAGTSSISPTHTVSTTFTVNKSHPLVSVLSMVAPSPDWFVGVRDLPLYENGRWRDRVSVDLYPYDAGTEDGDGWSLSNPDTTPRGSITSIRSTGRFLNNPLARLTFTLQPSSQPPPPDMSTPGEGTIDTEGSDDHVEDRMSAAWLARSGRAVAEQGLDGIAERMAVSRTPGLVGHLAGRSFGVTPWAGGGSGAGAVGRPAATEAGSTSGTRGASGADTALRAMAEVAHGFDRMHGSIETEDFGSAGVDPAGVNPAGFNARHLDRSQTLTERDLLFGSAFTLTGETDASGGSMAFWGRASHGAFDGKEGTLSLDGEMTTGMLGADYARGPWLFGLALAQSEGDGEYRDTAAASSQDNRPRDRAASSTDGTVESTLTAVLPYASWRASQQLNLWGAAGFGAGEMTLTTDAGASMPADTDWTMAALGLRSALLAPPAEGLALALVSDGLWVRTTSDRTEALAASEADVTRLRLGLEGSWRMALDAASGAHLTPNLALGLRHDGGDAETGLGVELGGGLAWSIPRIGLALDITGRTLLAHADGEFEDRGLAASLTFDPDPATDRGLSLSLRQEMGGSAQGGLDALFADAPMAKRTESDPSDPGDSSDPGHRWTAQAAYGLPAFSGRFVASPHLGLGFATGGDREYSLGGRLTPATRTNAPDLTFGVLAKRVESETRAPEHNIGLQLGIRW